MSSFKGTKGDWKIFLPIEQDGHFAVKSANTLVANVFGAEEPEEIEANARVISQAPNLLAVAEAILKDLQSTGFLRNETYEDLKQVIDNSLL